MLVNKWLRKAVLLAVSALTMQGSSGYCAALSVEDAVNMALQNNQSIKIAVYGEEKAGAQLEAARGGKRPSMALSSNLGWEENSKSSLNRYNANRVALSMPLYSGGKLELKIAKAEDNVAAKQYELRRTVENVRLDTVTAYYNILENEKLVKVGEDAVENYRSHLSNVQALYAAGSTPRIDVLRSEVELADAQQDLIKTRNDYDVAVTTLRNIIKLDRSEPISLVEDVEYKKVDIDLQQCLDMARASRSDLRKYELAVEQAHKDVGIARSDKRPTVSLSLGNSWEKAGLPSDDNYSWTAGVSASWNVFDGNVTNSNIKAADIAVKEAEMELSSQYDAVELAVEKAYLNLREAEKRFNTTEVAVNKAQEDYRIALARYRAGEGILLDVIDAQLALTKSQTNYIQARYDYATNEESLYNAMGITGGEDNVKK